MMALTQPTGDAKPNRRKSFEALALRALRRSPIQFSEKARSFLHRARLADAKSQLIAARTNRAARRRTEVHQHRHSMIWAGSKREAV